MNKKFEIVKDELGNIRIKALRDITDYLGDYIVHKGDLGGIVSGEYNLSHEGNCWIDYNAEVLDYCRVEDNSYITDKATLKGEITVKRNSLISGEANIQGKATIEDSSIRDSAYLSFNSVNRSNLFDCVVKDKSHILGLVTLERCRLEDWAVIMGNNINIKHSTIMDKVRISSNVQLNDGEWRKRFMPHLVVKGNAFIENCSLEPETVYKISTLGDSIYINSSFDDLKYFNSPLEGSPITALKVAGEWRYNIGCQKLITAQTFIERIYTKEGGLEDNPHRQFYLEVLELLEKKPIEELKGDAKDEQ